MEATANIFCVRRPRIQYPTYLGSHYDASTTNLSYVISLETSRPLEITVSFLSPITPTSTLRQSIPASYVTVHVEGDVDVNIYVDVDGRWVTGDTQSELTWEYNRVPYEKKADLRSWQITRETELLFSEINDRSEWGSLYLTGPSVRNPTLRIAHFPSTTIN